MSSENAEHLALFGLFGVGNLGNDATLLSALRHLRAAHPHARLSCICPQLPQFAAEFGVQWIPMDPLRPPGRWRIASRVLRETYVGAATVLTEPWRWSRVNAALRDVSRLMVVGTGVLDDYGEFPWTLPAWLLRWCFAARRKGLPVHFIAAGAGPLEHWLNRRMMTAAAGLATSRSYRDQESLAFMSALGVRANTDQVVPDLAFGLSPEKFTARGGLGPALTIGVGLMGYYGWRNDPQGGSEKFSRYIRKMAGVVSSLLIAGHRVHLLIGEVRTDDHAVEELMKTLSTLSLPSHAEPPTAPRIANPQELIEAVLRTDVVIASRFHNLVLALACGIPAISIGYSRKFAPLMRSAGFEKFDFGIEDFSEEEVLEGLRVLTRDHVKYREAAEKAALTSRKRVVDLLSSESF